MGRLAARVASRDLYDCVHLHDPWLAWGYWLGRWFYGHKKIRWGLTQHGFGSYTRATQEEGVDYTNGLLRWHHLVERRILSLAKFVVSPTLAARQQLQRDLQLAQCPEHWTVISHSRPSMRIWSRDAARTELGWRNDEFHLLAIGRIAPVKRFSLLIDACIQANRPLHITILGAGDIAPLQEKIHAYPLIHLSTLSTSDVSLYLSAADLYLSTSLNESFGLANVEAQWCGCPAICTAVGGVAEAVNGGVWLVPGEVLAVTKAIQTLYDEPNLRQSWSGIGKQSVAMLPDNLEVASLYETIYNS
jgi:glycosyltransferase involved in cell wall biosynthesis